MRRLETETISGKDITVYLTESQWRGLLRRFDEEMIHKEGGYFHISVPCALCVEFASKSGEACKFSCPLSGTGCLYLVERHGSEELSVCSSGNKIEWCEDEDEGIRAGIRKIRRFLLSLPRTRRVK